MLVGMRHTAVLSLGCLLLVLVMACGGTQQPTPAPTPALTSGDYSAIANYDEAIRLDPQDAITYYNRGVAYENLGQQEQADLDFAKAKELGVE